MSIENPIIPIHPEITEPIQQERGESFINRLCNVRPFYTAGLSREEYERLKGDFTLLASDLLARTTPDPSYAASLRGIKRNFEALVEVSKGLFFWELQWRVEGSVISDLGNNWKQKAVRSDVLLPARTPLSNDVDSRNADNERERLLFEPFDQYWFRFQWDFIGMQQDENKRTASTYVLLKDAFSDEEMGEIARRAIKDYELLTFGAKHIIVGDLSFSTYSFWHYQDAYLDVIGRLAPGRLAPEEIPKEIRIATPIDFFPTHMRGVEYLAVEDSETRQRVRIFNADRDFATSGDYTWGEPMWYRRTNINRPEGKLLSVGI